MLGEAQISSSLVIKPQVGSKEMEKKSLKEIKKIIRETIEERYSEEGVETIKMTQLECDSICWKGFGDVVLKDNTKKHISIKLSRGGEIEEFNESRL